ncbi:hypothetical protein LTR50_001200 [Elasticomyces elasticus]|nr:hypothetical protein LTR50_001200 [Elasticomyces elasticus]
MLATPAHHDRQPFAPSIPSPLSPRRADGRSSFLHPSSFMNTNASASGARHTRTPCPPRPTKQSRTVQGRDALRDKRRDLFLKKVQEGREDRRWDARGDQILRLDYVSQQRRWEAEQARSAPTLSAWPPEEDDDQNISVSNVQPSQWLANSTTHSRRLTSDEEIDAVVRREDEELQALLSMMETEDSRDHDDSTQDGPREEYGSDEEDYDSIFMDVICDERELEYGTGTRQDPACIRQQSQDPDAMDMTNG